MDQKNENNFRKKHAKLMHVFQIEPNNDLSKSAVAGHFGTEAE